MVAGCGDPDWYGDPLQLGASGSPTEFAYGRVRPDIVEVTFRYADGEPSSVRPTRGFILVAVPRRHLAEDARLTDVVGLDRDGKVVGRMSFVAPRRR